jgi:hypothetical protein
LNPLQKLIGGVKGKFGELFNYMVASTSIYEFVNMIKQAVNVVKEFDDALVEMRKVADEPLSVLKNYQKDSFGIADSIGTSALQLQQSTADFMRLGHNLEASKELAKNANILLNVSEFQGIDEATQSLIAMT